LLNSDIYASGEKSLYQSVMFIIKAPSSVQKDRFSMSFIGVDVDCVL
jgi:hypothetical protein